MAKARTPRKARPGNPKARTKRTNKSLIKVFDWAKSEGLGNNPIKGTKWEGLLNSVIMFPGKKKARKNR